MKRLLLSTAVFTAIAVGATGAMAAPYATPINNNVFDPLALPNVGAEGYLGATLYATGNLIVDLVLIGRKSAATNAFVLNGITYFSGSGTSGTITSPTGTTISGLSISAGMIDFQFLTDLIPGVVANGSNPLPPNTPNFFVSFNDFVIDGSSPGGGQIVYIALDDGGGGPDDNHDDLVVMLSITSGGTFTVPEPASLALLGAGLAGLGLAVRRRRQT